MPACCVWRGLSHTVNEPLEALPLRLARGQQVPDVLLQSWPVSEDSAPEEAVVRALGEADKGLADQVLDVAVSVDFLPHKEPRLVTGLVVGYPANATQHGPVEGQDAGALEELQAQGAASAS